MRRYERGRELHAVSEEYRAPGGSCRPSKYDPLKRVPPPPVAPDFSKLKDEDFTL